MEASIAIRASLVDLFHGRVLNILRAAHYRPPVEIKAGLVLLTEGCGMIEYKAGDIFDEQSEALVNSVNCVGVMGRGIALQFQETFSGQLQGVREACKRGKSSQAEFRLRIRPHDVSTLHHNFPTKRHWRGKSRMDDIEAGLGALVQEIQKRKIRSIAIPPLGTSLGGLRWADVRPSYRGSP